MFQSQIVSHLSVYYIPDHFTTSAISKRPLALSKGPNYLFGGFKTLSGFEMAWPFQNLIGLSDLSYDFQ